MINFKREEERLPSVLIVISLLTLLGVLLFMLLPTPSVKGLATKHETSHKQLQRDIENAEEETLKLAEAIRPRLWKGNAEAITAQVLAKATATVLPKKVKLTAFRPQRPQTFPGTTELPYNLILSGAYPAIRETLSIFDAPASKMVLRSVQFAASDAGSDIVTATVGVSVYAEVVEKPAPKPTTKPAPKKTAANSPQGEYHGTN
jgi:Tfp pilus assembly protein PilO